MDRELTDEELKAMVRNYVSALRDYTWDLEWFLNNMDDITRKDFESVASVFERVYLYREIELKHLAGIGGTYGFSKSEFVRRSFLQWHSL